MDEAEREGLFRLVLGRIFRIMSRPYRPGDTEEYERCRGIILDLFPDAVEPYRFNWARDRLKGAQGD